MMRNIILSILSFTLLAFVSCGKKTDVAEEIDSTALTIAVLPTYDCIPFYYADEEGLFDSLGVKVRLLTYNSAMDADTAFVNGVVHGAVSDIVKASLWRSKGDSIRIVMAIDPEISLVTAKSARLFNTASIKEKIIAITRHSLLDFTADKILESVKIKSEDLNKPQINNIKLRTKMTDQNQYDGALLPEPYTFEATKIWGGKLLTSSSKLGLRYMGALVFNDSIISQRGDEIRDVIKAYNLAVKELNKKKVYPLNYIPKESTVEVSDTLFEFIPFKEAGNPSDSLLQKVNKWIIGRGLVKNGCTYQVLVDTTFCK